MRGQPIFGQARAELGEPYRTALRRLIKTRGAQPTADLLGSSAGVVHGAAAGLPMIARTTERLAKCLGELLEQGAVPSSHPEDLELVCLTKPVCRCSLIEGECACRRRRHPREKHHSCLDCGSRLFPVVHTETR